MLKFILKLSAALTFCSEIASLKVQKCFYFIQNTIEGRHK